MDSDPDDDALAVWQTQPAQTVTAEEIRRTVEETERRMRRNRISFVLAIVGSCAVIVALALLAARPLAWAGAAATIAGLAFLLWEVARHGRRRPVAEDGATVSLDYQRALLRHRLEFHRTRLWLRVIALTPGGVLFFIAVAAARPDLAPLMYLELATFIAGAALIVPMNRRAAARLERAIADIDRLR